ncbi:hypothetical protein [Clostridium botulinum]|uniref:Uncharacterized protein n=1 Tax=Clostridium botulinum (strain Langeland / NCTC 10281 / Type F) TaxID=441772 RepID=A7GBY6_CLOBL|nr:hypothetical protein [Clostridium botulinum]ABS40684.1 hypothetical protein CLI_1030 [Clostridium botulinum F str. Langeland]ADF98764.1 hypothetical protein CBF_1000 [Clostridium botulinum F str. 230613]KKM39959.1 membrane protein [Clostridium botulinum]MBY6792028.1 hypothetical protein [Clostridium botulinum]MBY6825569.1 hypothetical protein [Clostridium botulinum]
MEKSKTYNFLLWIVGFILAELWRRLLKNIHIHEFFKWFIGVAIIILIIFIINKVISLLTKVKN